MNQTDNKQKSQTQKHTERFLTTFRLRSALLRTLQDMLEMSSSTEPLTFDLMYLISVFGYTAGDGNHTCVDEHSEE